MTAASEPRVSLFVTVAQFCRDIGIARSTFDEWRAKGKGPRCIKLPNGQLRIRIAELNRWLTKLEDEVA